MGTYSDYPNTVEIQNLQIVGDDLQVQIKAAGIFQDHEYLIHCEGGNFFFFK